MFYVFGVVFQFHWPLNVSTLEVLTQWHVVAGVAKFHECSVNELEQMDTDADNFSLAGSVSMLDQYVGHARESLGVETHLPSSTCSSR